MKGLSRFRANIFMQRGAVAGAFRTIPFKILTFEELGLPPVVAELRQQAARPGAGHRARPARASSTTLAAIIDKINSEQRLHIMTIEDPIEYLHPHKLCDREPARGRAPTPRAFKDALKYVLRQDPDVVLVGEMRDLETIEAALTISETGHLVFATLHTNSADLDHQPHHRRLPAAPAAAGAREALVRAPGRRHRSSSCRAPTRPGRVLAMEVMVPNPAIRNLIREDKVHQIYSQMQVGQDKHGMQTLNQSLFSLFQRRLISHEEATGRSVEPEELRMMMEGRTAMAQQGAPGAPPARRG